MPDGSTVSENPEDAQPGWRIQGFDGEPADWPEIVSLGEQYDNADFPGWRFIGATVVGRDDPIELVVGQPIYFWVPAVEPVARGAASS